MPSIVIACMSSARSFLIDLFVFMTPVFIGLVAIIICVRLTLGWFRMSVRFKRRYRK